jgi:deoxyribodipyrimidine photo-lyase
LRQVVTAYPPIGPTAEAVSDMQELFSAHGIRLVQILREWDKAAWPHATHGFFRFRRHIPQIIETARTNDRRSASGWDSPAVAGATGQKHQRL